MRNEDGKDKTWACKGDSTGGTAHWRSSEESLRWFGHVQWKRDIKRSDINKILDITNYFLRSQLITLLCFVLFKNWVLNPQSWYNKISDIANKISRSRGSCNIYQVSTVGEGERGRIKLPSDGSKGGRSNAPPPPPPKKKEKKLTMMFLNIKICIRMLRNKVQSIKHPRASRALNWALDPGRKGLGLRACDVWVHT